MHPIHIYIQAGTAFWASIPSSVYIPMLVLGTLAAIIASQALITGAFSITRQGIAIKCFPRFTVHHTSEHSEGQIYIPEINFSLMIGCIIIVLAFGSSTRIGNAYGLAIITVMVIDTFLLAIAMLVVWNWHPLAVGSFFVLYTFISCAYLSSNLEKIPHGAWFSIALAGILSIVSYIYWWGQRAKVEYIKSHAVPITDVLEEGDVLVEDEEGEKKSLVTNTSINGTKKSTPALGKVLLQRNNTMRSVLAKDDESSALIKMPSTLQLVGTKTHVNRLPGLGLYFSELLEGVPPALVRYLTLSPSIHEAVVMVTVRHVPLPHVRPDLRLLVRRLDIPGFYHVVARYGYMEDVDLGDDFVRVVVDELLQYLHPGAVDAAEDVANAAAAEEEEEEREEGESGVSSKDKKNEDMEAMESGVSGLGPMPKFDSNSGGKPTLKTTWTSVGSKRFITVGMPPTDGTNGTDTSTGVSTAVVPPAGSVSRRRLVMSVSNLSGGGPALGRGSGSGNATNSTNTSNRSATFSRSRTMSIPKETGTATTTSRPWVRQPSMFTRPLSVQDGATRWASALGRRSSNTTNTGGWGSGSDLEDLPLPPAHRAIYRGGGELTKEASKVSEDALNLRVAEEVYLAEKNADPFAKERARLLSAYSHGVVHLLGRAELKAKSLSGKQGVGARAQNVFKQFMINKMYWFLTTNTRSASADYHLPDDTMIELTVKYKV